MIESPCISVCRMSEAHGVCIGCYRTVQEIAGWSKMNDTERRRIMDALTQRRQAMEDLLFEQG